MKYIFLGIHSHKKKNKFMHSVRISANKTSNPHKHIQMSKNAIFCNVLSKTLKHCSIDPHTLLCCNANTQFMLYRLPYLCVYLQTHLCHASHNKIFIFIYNNNKKLFIDRWLENWICLCPHQHTIHMQYVQHILKSNSLPLMLCTWL